MDDHCGSIVGADWPSHGYVEERADLDDLEPWEFELIVGDSDLEKILSHLQSMWDDGVDFTCDRIFTDDYDIEAVVCTRGNIAVYVTQDDDGGFTITTWNVSADDLVTARPASSVESAAVLIQTELHLI